MSTTSETSRSTLYGRTLAAGQRTSLRDQSLTLLVALLERPGELVTREELTERLWPDGTFVDFGTGGWKFTASKSGVLSIINPLPQ
jgi:DNA-binding response OmpR family regulator